MKEINIDLNIWSYLLCTFWRKNISFFSLYIFTFLLFRFKIFDHIRCTSIAP